jgi:hypothetical protein
MLAPNQGNNAMPLHAQIVCFGGNAVFALIFLLGAVAASDEGDSGLAAFLTVLMVAALYCGWVLLKFRKYLSAEVAMQRDLEIERLYEEIQTLRANNPGGGPAPG